MNLVTLADKVDLSKFKDKNKGVRRAKIIKALQSKVVYVTGAAGQPPSEWNLDALHAPLLWAADITGTGIIVVNMDTGVDADHPDLANWRGGLNSWYDPNGQHATPYDSNGHGTQSMSLIAGGSAGDSAIGMAPDAQRIAVKIFNAANVDSAMAGYTRSLWRRVLPSGWRI